MKDCSEEGLAYSPEPMQPFVFARGEGGGMKESPRPWKESAKACSYASHDATLHVSQQRNAIL
eukprot:1076944-Amphidinium_carterae.1